MRMHMRGGYDDANLNSGYEDAAGKFVSLSTHLLNSLLYISVHHSYFKSTLPILQTHPSYSFLILHIHCNNPLHSHTHCSLPIHVRRDYCAWPPSSPYFSMPSDYTHHTRSLSLIYFHPPRSHSYPFFSLTRSPPIPHSFISLYHMLFIPIFLQVYQTYSPPIPIFHTTHTHPSCCPYPFLTHASESRTPMVTFYAPMHITTFLSLHHMPFMRSCWLIER